jgi:hypothetical protein
VIEENMRLLGSNGRRKADARREKSRSRVRVLKQLSHKPNTQFATNNDCSVYPAPDGFRRQAAEILKQTQTNANHVLAK